MQNNLNFFIAAITDRLYAEGSRKDNPIIPRGLLLQRPAPQTLAFVPDPSPLAPAAAFTPQLESALPAAMSLALAEVFHPVLARFLTHQEVAPPYPVIVAAATLDLYKVVLLPHTLPSLVSWNSSDKDKKLAEKYDNIELDVFSSFKLYGWEERDKQFASVIERCKEHPKINYHGSQPNEVVRAAIAKSHIFAYPSIWQETSCICAMEAMSAGNLIVTSNLAALPETTAGYAMMYQYHEDLNQHANRFYGQLDNAINAWFGAGEPLARHLMEQKHYADTMYSWQRRAAEWNQLLRSL
jgi:hypothetical protein